MKKTILRGTTLTFSIGNQDIMAETLYRTTFISENGKDEFLITVPRINNEFHALHPGEWCNFSFYDEIGFYFFSAVAGPQLIKHGLLLYSMVQKTELDFIQRRDNFRLPFTLEGKLMSNNNSRDSTMHNFNTFNISASGLGLKTDAQLSVGDRPVIHMALENEKPLIMEAEICWKKDLSDREFLPKNSYGLSLIHGNNMQKEYIAKFVFRKQIEQHKFKI